MKPPTVRIVSTLLDDVSFLPLRKPYTPQSVLPARRPRNVFGKKFVVAAVALTPLTWLVPLRWKISSSEFIDVRPGSIYVNVAS